MKRINNILNDPEYLTYLNKIQKAEAERVYCHHDLTHFLDVSRIAFILSLEGKLDIDKEIIHAAGVLHDIGRWMEYENGLDHAAASRALGAGILRKCGFSDIEMEEILSAIAGHRNLSGASVLTDILYKADKLSRNCTLCDARATCKKFQNDEKPFLQY
jgi:putative nucleotidyltransferase with HDIG domain